MEIIICADWVWCRASTFDEFNELIRRLFPAARCDKMNSRMKGSYTYTLAHKELGQGRLAAWTKDGNGFINKELYIDAASSAAARAWARTAVPVSSSA